jgi:HAD superfamily hydrolase (TIGR01490 family)
MGIAFFDLDKTVLAVNSGRLWVRRESALGNLGVGQTLQAVAWLVRYELGFASAETMVAQAVAHTRGTPGADLQGRTERFYQAEVRSTFRPGALAAIEEHRRVGDTLTLLTSSSGYLADLVAQELGFARVCCNRLDVDGDGLHTGRVLGRVCFGAGKLVHAQREADLAGVPLSACAFYTDSFSDLAVLTQVGRPVAVNPDPRLRREAGRRGWPVVDWGRPGPPGKVA